MDCYLITIMMSATKYKTRECYVGVCISGNLNGNVESGKEVFLGKETYM